MRDMIPKGERSIRNIPVPANHRRAPVEESAPQARAVEEVQYDDTEDTFDEPVLPRKKIFNMKKNWFFGIIIAVLALCAVGGVALSTLFAGATITVTPRAATVDVPGTMVAQMSGSADVLAYQVVSTSRTASTTVKATGSAQVSKTASGDVVIYNAYSTSPQLLIPKTRFEAPNGNIYKIKSAITVPGAKAAADGTLTPGTVTVKVYADAPGSTYNIGQAQLTIPGFKGDPRFTKFYAQTSGISGGFVGQQATVAPADLTAAQNALKQSLQKALEDAIATQVPKEYMPVSGTLAVTYSDITQTPAGDGSMAALSLLATASVDTVRANDLAAAIAKQKVEGYSGESVAFADASTVTLGVPPGVSQGQGTLQLALSGSPTLVWQFDPEALKKALLGKPKGTFEQIVRSFAPAITCSKDTPCSASINPFWSSTFPGNPAKIKILTK